MKRSKQLYPLSMEHHLSLSLGNKAVKAARSGDQDAIARLSQEIAEDFPERWETHFSNEEATVFPLLENHTDGPIQLLMELRRQHDQMRAMARELAAGNTTILEDFGQLLKDHTRLEERELFPIAEELLSEEELDSVLAITSSDR